jgi:DNA-binding LacI/PurR family transcriptional regulator
MADIATAAGVSIQTVSRVMSLKPDVAASTRERVLAEAERLGYGRMPRGAQALGAAQPVLGLVTRPIANEFRAALIIGLEQEARKRGYMVMLGLTNGNADEVPAMCDRLSAQGVVGLFVIVPSPIRGLITASPVPVVTYAYALGLGNATNVDINNIEGAYTAVRRLTELGHRRVGVVAGPSGWSATTNRVEGARRALAQVGVELEPCCIQEIEEADADQGYAATARLLERCPDLTALFCYTDVVAVGAYRALGERGLRIPQDVSVIGFDDMPMCRYCVPPLSSVIAPKESLGQLLAQLLIDAVEHDTVSEHDVLLSLGFAERESIGPARN